MVDRFASQFSHRTVWTRLRTLAGIALICAISAAIGLAVPSVAKPVAAISFPQDHSDLKADPAQIYGRLPNGLTYIIQKNATPRGTAVIYMRVAAGSMMETEKQRGLAHFIEHMAFEGTTNIPAGELKRTLERHGFAFGADANAFTSDSQTVYQLKAPKADDETLDTGLFLLREVAGNMTLDARAVDSERGVILSEERLRDKPALHYAAKLNSWLYPGQKFATAWSPIGSVDIIKSASRADLAVFYDSWYRPELTTLIIVGDFDPAKMEAKVKAKFSDWTARRAMPEEPQWGEHAPVGLRTFGYAEKGLADEIQVRWVKPFDDTPDSTRKRLDGYKDTLLFNLLNRRLAARVSDPDTAYLRAEIRWSEHFRTDRAVFLAIVPKPGKSKEAFTQAYKIFQTFRAYGVAPGETDALNASLVARETALVNERKAPSSAGIANALLGRLGDNTVYLSLADGLKLNDTLKSEATQAGLNGRLKTLFDGDGPALLRVGESIADYDVAAMKADYLALHAQMPATYAEAEKKGWTYTDFGPAVAPVSHTVDKDFGFHHYVYPNGVRLNIKPAKEAAGNVAIYVDFPGGRQKFDPAADRPLALATVNFLTPGGLAKLTANEIREALPGKRFSVGYQMFDNTTVLTGETVTGDLPIQMQMLMAYVTDPGLRADRYRPYQAAAPEALRILKTDPAKVLGYYLSTALRPGDNRFDQRILERIDQVKFEDIASIYTDSMRDTPIVITILGDVDLAQAVEEVNKTFATLPQRPAQAQSFTGANTSRFPPAEHEFTFLHEGRDDQSISLVIWPTTDFYASGKDAYGLRILAGVLRNRLFDELRRKQGADYTPQAISSQSENYPGFGYVMARVTVKAGADGEFRKTLAGIVDDLKTKPITDDERLRVVAPVVEQLKVRNKSYWTAVMRAVEIDPRTRDTFLHQSEGYQGVTTADLTRLAQTYLKDDTAIHVKVIPATPTP